MFRSQRSTIVRNLRAKAQAKIDETGFIILNPDFSMSKFIFFLIIV